MGGAGKLDLTSKRNFLQAIILLVIVVLLLAYCSWGSHPDPQMNMKHLGGLTPDQVIARLGPPQRDPRKLDPNDPRYKPWTPDQEAERGPLTFYYSFDDYRWLGFSYGIVFEKNRVVKVAVGHK